MRISVDISLYPLSQDYVEPILAFIAKLETNPKLIVKRNSLSTQIFGEYRDVMDCLDSDIEAVFEQLPESVFVLKLVGMDRADIVDV
ncbi:MAG: hypothetical protein HRT92_08485 [Piscirickettsiaceae bacterium]|nr:hypothetical protein [Piscirickettsiaceae bacterium]